MFVLIIYYHITCTVHVTMMSVEVVQVVVRSIQNIHSSEFLKVNEAYPRYLEPKVVHTMAMWRTTCSLDRTEVARDATLQQYTGLNWSHWEFIVLCQLVESPRLPRLRQSDRLVIGGQRTVPGLTAGPVMYQTVHVSLLTQVECDCNVTISVKTSTCCRVIPGWATAVYRWEYETCWIEGCLLQYRPHHGSVVSHR